MSSSPQPLRCACVASTYGHYACLLTRVVLGIVIICTAQLSSDAAYERARWAVLFLYLGAYALYVVMRDAPLPWRNTSLQRLISDNDVDAEAGVQPSCAWYVLVRLGFRYLLLLYAVILAAFDRHARAALIVFGAVLLLNAVWTCILLAVRARSSTSVSTGAVGGARTLTSYPASVPPSMAFVARA